MAVYIDRDWEDLRPALRHSLHADMRPWPNSGDSWHFYRNNFAAWNLTEWEALEATALAGKTGFRVEQKRVVFELDQRPRIAPKLESFPR